MNAQAEPKSRSAVTMLNRILVPTDFSEESKKAFVYAAALAEQFNASLSVLFVLEMAPFMSGFETMPLVLDTSAAMSSARRELSNWIQAQVPGTIPATPLVREGQGYAQIVEVARTEKIDLIVISTHGYTGLKHVLMGSTAERVVRHAPCPVLVVRAKEHEFVSTASAGGTQSESRSSKQTI